ncbi:CPBP family intramembrane glutamic endopeptidase [Flexivirga meconopsidis]|uniref:CPBP family intramembrane glutamic endopeptidase n=1 Tax=Flexivirga meconopsidis TaxID=2977121 RepID=UPI00224000E0|nr:CPBP family intramembrane glutamic endopeptidase [Flexivirga meconopsidis]
MTTHADPTATTTSTTPAKASPWRDVPIFALVTLIASGGLIALQEFAGSVLGAGTDGPAQWVQFAPAIGVLAIGLRRVHAGNTRVRDYFANAPGLLVRSFTAGLTSAAVALGWAGLMHATGMTDSFAVPLELSAGGLVAASAWIVVGSFGEEVGWRGWLQPLLQDRTGWWTGAVVTGLIWGVWHVQAVTSGFGYAAAFLASTIGLSLLMAAFAARLRTGYVWVAGVVHAAFDLALLTRGNGSGADVGQEALLGGIVLAAGIASAAIARRR